MGKYQDYGKIFNKPYAIEIFSTNETGIGKKRSLRKKSILQAPFNELFRLAESIELYTPDYNSKLIIELTGPAYYFYFFLKKLCWYFDISNIEFRCHFENKHNSDFMISKMENFVFAVTEKNSLEYDYLFCKSCIVQRKHYSIDKESAIDFIIPVRNTPESELKACLRSLESQVKNLDRIFIIDDNDAPMINAEIFKEFAFNYEIIRGNADGIGAARNLGARKGANPLVLFVDSDDYILPGFVSKQRSFHGNHFEIGATGTWLQAFGAHNRIFPQWDNISPLSVLSCLPPAGVLMWKRKALEELNFFNANYNIGFEDFDLVARATVERIPIVVLDEILYMYRRGHKSLSQNWNSSQEMALRNSVNLNLKDLCIHEFTSFLELNSIFGSAIYQGNPDFVFIKQKLDSIFSLFFCLLPKNIRRLSIRVIVKFFPFFLNYLPNPREGSRTFMQLRQIKWLSKLWNKLPNKIKYSLFKKFFS